MNFYSNISLFHFSSDAKNWKWVSKFHFSFFAEIEITKSDTLKLGFNESKTETITCLIYVHFVTKPFCWSKDKATSISSVLYPKPLGKNAFHLLWTEIPEVILTMTKVALQQFRMPLLRSTQQKESWWPKREPYQCGPLVGIVYKDNFKNFFQMTMSFFAYVVTFLGQLHFTTNYFFTVNTSI